MSLIVAYDVAVQGLQITFASIPAALDSLTTALLCGVRMFVPIETSAQTLELADR